MRIRWTWRLLPWIGILIVMIVGLGAFMIPRGTASSPPAPDVLAGTVLPAKPAPDFHLRDQFGHTVSLAQFRGHPVILTTMEAHCLELCPVVAETIRRTLAELGPAGRKVGVVALSTDPVGDTPAAVRQFSRQRGMLHRWAYLTGSHATLIPIWHAYFIYAAPPSAPPKVRDAHTSVTYLIDGRGRERVLMAGDPSTSDLQHDLLILSGLPVKPVGAFALPAPQVGHPAPKFTLRTLNGSDVTLDSLRGKTVLLNFWATWCVPCRSEAPRLARWYNRLRGKGLVVLGVDQQEGHGDVAAFVKQHHLSYPVALDSSGSVSAAYDVPALPKSLLIDRQGTVQSIILGGVDDHFMSTHVAPLLQAQSGA